MRHRFLIVLILNLFLCIPLSAQQSATTIILVRHAEKATKPADDPGLTERGASRAEYLAKMFEKSGLTAVYSSQYARTRKTAEPVAQKLGLKVQTVHAESTNKLVETILARNTGGTVLVVGHSNTLPEIIQALGGGKITEIADEDYDNLYFVTVTQKGKGKTLRVQFSPCPIDPVCQ